MSQKPNVHAETNPRSRRWMLYLLAAIGVLALVFLREPVLSLFREKKLDQPAVPQKSTPEARRIAFERSKPHLDKADAESQRLIDEHIRTLDVFFDDVKKRTPAFAEDVLGWSSKWRLVVDKLPYTRTDRNQEYLREQFNNRLFTPDQLAQTVEMVTKGYVASIQNIERQMLVGIKADIQDLPRSSLPHFSTKEATERAFQGAIETAAQKAQASMRDEAIRSLVFQMSVVQNQILSWLWSWFSDPAGDLAKAMNDKLDQIHKLIIDGEGTKPGLRAQLMELHEKRKPVRRQAVNEMIEGKVQP